MRDPVERMRKFVEDQRQQARLEHARAAWSRKVAEFLPTLEAVADAFRAGLAPGQFPGDAVTVLADPDRDPFPLVVVFAPRCGRDETGASAQFRCEADGSVRAVRYPCHGVLHSPDPEPFLDLGDPATVTAEELGNAVASFLEWVAVGGGCEPRLAFWPPPDVRPQLSLVAA
jgi:hypothetical protein